MRYTKHVISHVDVTDTFRSAMGLGKANMNSHKVCVCVCGIPKNEKKIWESPPHTAEVLLGGSEHLRGMVL